MHIQINDMRLIKQLFSLVFFIGFASLLSAQKPAEVMSGPMLGPVEFRTANVWIELKEGIDEVSLLYWPKSKTKTSAKKIFQKKTTTGFPNIYKWQVPQLEPGSSYQYNVVAG